MATIGLAVKNPEAAQSAVFLPVFPLVFASSVFVPTDTMPAWLQAFAENQPITVTVNALRGLMLGRESLADYLPGMNADQLAQAVANAPTVAGQVLAVPRLGRSDHDHLRPAGDSGLPQDGELVMTQLGESLALTSRVTIPVLGLGVYRSPAGKETRQAVAAALVAGYRHIDTAAIYQNEADVGQAVRDSGLDRSEVFITTKLWNDSHGYEAALQAFKESKARLSVDQVDLYLIHWPVPELRKQTWRAMEHLLEEGEVRSIGVSNYMVRHLDELVGDRLSPAGGEPDRTIALQLSVPPGGCRLLRGA